MSPSVDARPFHMWRLAELKAECRKYGLKVGGKKAELIQRLSAAPATSSTNTKSKRKILHDDSKRSVRQKSDQDKEKLVAKIDELFDKYEDPDCCDEITDEGIAKFYDDLNVDPQDIIVLVLSWYMNAETMCTYTRDEFRRGLCSLNCSTTAELVTKLGTLRMKLKDAKIFSQCISVDAAIALWHILLEGRFLRLADWLSFVKENQTKAITKDLWKQLLEFTKQIKSDLSNFDENGAWPVLLDDFVARVKSNSS